LISDKEDEILSIRQHFGSIIDKNTNAFQEVNKQRAYLSEQPSKPGILLFGNSNIKYINPEKWHNYQTSKITAYTIQEKVNGYKQDVIPDVIFFHSLTNDIQNLSSSDCVHQLTSLINNTQSRFPKSKIIVSLATPRKDRMDWNDNGDLVNIMLKEKFRNAEHILLCDNSNLSYKGTPKLKMLDQDGFHLSEEGSAVLASNIKQLIDHACNTNKPQSFTANNDNSGNPSNRYKGNRSGRGNRGNYSGYNRDRFQY
jgi:lysophospholipase L1-like esterase